MTDRRAILAIGGAIVGILGGILAAANGAPVGGAIAAAGALIAALAAATSRPDPRDHLTPLASNTSDETRNQTASTTSTVPDNAPAPESVSSDERRETTDDQAVSSPPVAANAAAGFAPPTEPPAPDTSGLFDAPRDNAAPLLTDPITGLFSQDYFNIAMEARIAAARRHLRPVGVVLLEVVEGLRDDHPTPTDPTRVADAIRTTLREADTAARRRDGKFALLLEDTPENGAIWTVERIRRHLVDADPTLTVWAGVACYPAHAFDKESIVRAADAALVAAREWHQDRIEVAIGE